MSKKPARGKIRLGMVRADGHAYTYGPLLERCDPLRFREYFHAEYFWMIDGAQPEKLRTPIVPGFTLAKVFDTDRTKAENVSHTFFDKPEVCASLDEMTEGIDAAFVNDCNGEGQDHLKLAAPFLKKGIPTFVDKPFAYTLKDARAIVRLAERHNAPLFSASILGYVNEVTYLKRRFREIVGPLRLGIVKGAGGPLGAVIHGIALAQGVFGTGVESVESIGPRPLDYLLLYYPDRIEVMVVNAKVFDGFRCDVYSQAGGHNPPLPGHLRSNTIYDHEFIGGALNILRIFKRMIRTRKAPVPYEQLVEPIAIVEAGRLAHERGERVSLSARSRKPR